MKIKMIVLSLIASICVVVTHGAPSDLHFYPSSRQYYPSGSEAPFQKAWVTFKAQHGKIYVGLKEEYQRMKVFEENLKKIESHNYLYDMGLKDYKMGINQFADMELHEVVQHKGLKSSRKNSTQYPSTYLPMITVAIPKAVDWREKGYVTPVKNQFSCGSCWAFSSTGSLEGQNFRKTGKLVSLSEQNLIDCSSDEGNEGCDGGLMDAAFAYIKDNGGIDTEESYPYLGVVRSCRYRAADSGATVTGYMDIESGNEDKLTNAVATVGPIAVGVNAKESLLSYKGGIYDEAACSADALNHGVLVVGYGSENGKDYYIVKNSWGASWGEGGYFRLARNKSNMCGVSSMASYPLV